MGLGYVITMPGLVIKLMHDLIIRDFKRMGIELLYVLASPPKFDYSVIQPLFSKSLHEVHTVAYQRFSSMNIFSHFLWFNRSVFVFFAYYICKNDVPFSRFSNSLPKNDVQVW